MLGTSIKFNVLLEGESLLNDGTAFVFFLVFVDYVEHEKFRWGNFVAQFFRLSLGGPGLGLILGIIFYQVLNWFKMWKLLFVVMVFFCSYFTFWLAETTLFQIHVSGILAIVVCGLLLNHYIKPQLKHSLEHTTESIMTFLAYIIETALFVLTGIYIGIRLIDTGNGTLFDTIE